MRYLQKFLNKLNDNKKNIWVVGDAMLDEYFQVKISRISPEFPTQIMWSADEGPHNVKPGGAANTCFQMRDFNIITTLFAPLDQSAFDCLINYNFKIEPYMLEGQQRIPRKRRFYDGDYPLPRWDIEQSNYGHNDPKEMRNGLLEVFKNKIKETKPDVVIFSDYNKGIFDDNVCKEYIAICKQHKIKTIVDPKNTLNCWKGCDIFKPNIKEALELSNVKNETKAISKIRDRLGCQAVVVTRGGKFPLFSDNKKWIVIEVKDNESNYKNMIEKAQNVSGAGDCFASILAIATAYGLEPYEAAIVAYEAGIKYVTNKFNNPISPKDLLSFFDPISTKFVSAEELATRDYKLAFTNGCFDFGLTRGHIECLKYAKNKADKLIVGINSDESVRKLKGIGRPVLSLEDRMQILANLEIVDFVISFDEDTPIKLIETIKPDLIIKGGDYKPNEVCGNKIAKVYICPLYEGLSTTEKLKQSKILETI